MILFTVQITTIIQDNNNDDFEIKKRIVNILPNYLIVGDVITNLHSE